MGAQPAAECPKLHVRSARAWIEVATKLALSKNNNKVQGLLGHTGHAACAADDGIVGSNGGCGGGSGGDINRFLQLQGCCEAVGAPVSGVGAPSVPLCMLSL